MDEQSSAARGAVGAMGWERPAWLDRSTLDSVHELNEQALELMRVQFLGGSEQSAFTAAVGQRLIGLDATTLQRAAGCGVLLVDAAFADGRFWLDSVVGAVNDRQRRVPAPFFTVDGTVTMVRQVLMQAWHLARSQPTAGRLLLGLSEINLGVIGGCTLNRLTRLADASAPWLRPRWESRPKIWRDLLQLAATGSPESMERMRMRGLQLLAADARQG